LDPPAGISLGKRIQYFEHPKFFAQKVIRIFMDNLFHATTMWIPFFPDTPQKLCGRTQKPCPTLAFANVDPLPILGLLSRVFDYREASYYHSDIIHFSFSLFESKVAKLQHHEAHGAPHAAGCPQAQWVLDSPQR
jgi:hypothetical protein